MLAALTLPVFSPYFSDAPQILITHMALGYYVRAPPDLRAFARRYGRHRAVLVDRVAAFPLIIGAVGADLLDLSGRVLK